MRQTQHITQRVDLPLPLRDPRQHLRLVTHRPRQRLVRDVLRKRVRIRIPQHKRSMTPHHTLQHHSQLRILPRKRKVSRDLRRRVPEPHRVDVARHHIRIRHTTHPGSRDRRIDRRIERIRKALREHPRKLLVRHPRHRLRDHPLDRITRKQPFADPGPPLERSHLHPHLRQPAPRQHQSPHATPHHIPPAHTAQIKPPKHQGKAITHGVKR